MSESKKISEFSRLGDPIDTDTIPVVRSGVDNKISYVGDIRKNRSNQCSYVNPKFSSFENVQDVLDYLLYSASFLSLSITDPSSTTLLLGTTVTTLTFTWSLTPNVTLIGQAINQGVGDISPTLRAFTLNSLSLTSDIDYTLSADDGVSVVSSTAGLRFRNLYYVGTPSAVPTTSSAVRAISSGVFAEGRSRIFTSNPAGNYICFAYPSRFGESNISVNGLSSTAFGRATISVTNAAGYTEDYYVYTSFTLQQGTGIAVSIT